MIPRFLTVTVIQLKRLSLYWTILVVVKAFLSMKASLLLREKKLVKIGGLSTEEYFNEYRPRTDAYLFEKD